uniref:Uncharacterized protein n=1 Tax=Anguilla anguilla TaxID=7936 RepID=A0A0E9TBD3_ANGAN
MPSSYKPWVAWILKNKNKLKTENCHILIPPETHRTSDTFGNNKIISNSKHYKKFKIDLFAFGRRETRQQF